VCVCVVEAMCLPGTADPDASGLRSSVLNAPQFPVEGAL
jgi:hypothetical protein